MNNDPNAENALKDNLTGQGVEIEELYNQSNNLPEAGLMQTKSPYSTAVQVIKPRNLNLVEQRCVAEAARAGDEFYYSWSQGGSIIEGNTVGAALMMVRNWGNCAVDVRVSETPNSYVFYGAFIDLETGFNLVRPFKMSKQSPKNKNGRDTYSGERGKDIIFQIGASKAIRNVTLNAIPKWLSEKVLDTAKNNIIGKIKTMGKEKAIDKIIKKAEAIKIPFDRIEANYGKKESWDIDKIVAVMGAIRSVEDGIESIDEVFAEKTAVHGEPEFKDKKKESSKAESKDKKNIAKPEIDWENPASVTTTVNELYQEELTGQEIIGNIQKFKDDNKARLEMLSGDKLIQDAFDVVEKKALKKK